MDLSCFTFLKMLSKFNGLTEEIISVLLERGDCVVMDNCGFHHGLFVEPVLRELLNDYGVQLIYQPPYCPHLNTCEYCFHQLKEFLRRCHILAMEETKIAISEGVSSISTTISHNYFRNCGYIYI